MPSPTRIIINLAPADLRKEGPAYDLPIALGIMAATDQINADLNHIVFWRNGRELCSSQPPAGRFQQLRLRWIAVVAASAGGYMLFRGLVSLGCSAKPLLVQLSK